MPAVPRARPGCNCLPGLILEAMRPRQWSKNLFVYAAMVFTDNWRSWPLVTLCFGLFCLVSGAVYLLNDISDREQDRVHPEKQSRPIASGRLPVAAAAVAAALFAIGGAVASFAVSTMFGIGIVGYLILQVAYTLALKRMVLVDAFAIAAGFVIRAAAGGWALYVPVSAWLLVCTLQLALFLAFGKRRHELVALEGDAADHRQALSSYSLPLLDQIIAVTLGGLTVSYAVYCINSPTAIRHPMLALSLPFVMFGVFRYLYLIHIEHRGGTPEKILAQDRTMQVDLGLWLLAVVAAFRW